MSTDVQVTFFTKSKNPRLQLAEGQAGPYVLPTSVARIELSTFLRGLLELEDHLSFDFRIKGHLLAQSLQDYLEISGGTSEELLDIEYCLAWRAEAPKDIGETPSAILSLRKINDQACVLCVGGRVYVQDKLEECEKPVTVRVENDMPLDLLYHPTFGTKALVVAQNGEMVAVDIANLKAGEVMPMTHLLEVSGEALARARLSNDGAKLAVIDHQGQIAVFDTSRFLVQKPQSKKRKANDLQCEPVAPTVTFATTLKEVAGIAFVNHDNVIVGAGQTLALYSLTEQTRLAAVHANKMIMALSSVSSANQVCTAHFDGRVRAWNLIDLKEIKPIAAWVAHSRCTTALEWSSETEDVFATIGNDQVLTTIDVNTKITPIATVKLGEGNPAKACEIPHMPTCLAWWSDRLIVYGTTHNKLISCHFSDRVQA